MNKKFSHSAMTTAVTWERNLATFHVGLLASWPPNIITANLIPCTTFMGESITGVHCMIVCWTIYWHLSPYLGTWSLATFMAPSYMKVHYMIPYWTVGRPVDPWHHPPGNLVKALNYYGTSIPSSLLLPSKENPAQSLFLWCINIYERIYHNVPWMVKWTAKFKETSAVIFISNSLLVKWCIDGF